MGIWGFVASGGGTIGVLLSGVLVGTLRWPWIFFVNLPVGAPALALCRPLLDAGRSSGADASEGFDLAGAFLIATSILAAVYAVVGTETAGWTSSKTILLSAASAALLAAFVAVERRAGSPCPPRRLPLAQPDGEQRRHGSDRRRHIRMVLL